MCNCRNDTRSVCASPNFCTEIRLVVLVLILVQHEVNIIKEKQVQHEVNIIKEELHIMS